MNITSRITRRHCLKIVDTTTAFVRMALLAAAFALPLGAACAEQASSEELLLGFEEDEIKERILPVLGKFLRFMTPVEGGFDLNDRVGMLGGGFGSNVTWKVRPGHASQGTLALLLTGYKGLVSGMGVYSGNYPFAWDPLNYQPPLKNPRTPRLDGFYAAVGPYYHQMHAAGGNRALAISTSAFRRFFPMDWSDYDLLRFDVFCETATNTFRVTLEDEDIEPPVVRNIRCEPRQWVTAEVDLHAAAQARGLDTKRMAGLSMVLVAGNYGRVWLDNIRLCTRGAPAPLPIARDNAPSELSPAAKAYYGRSARTQPEVLPRLTPDRTRLVIEEPFVIEGPLLDAVATARNLPAGAPVPKNHGNEYIALAPCGWVAAYDNAHLLVGFTGFGERSVFAVQSLDGGRHWSGLDGGAIATTVPAPNPNHGSGPGNAVGQRADVLLLTNLGCCGFSAGIRLFAQKLTFTAGGWQLRHEPALVDCDPRHCVSNQSVIRLRSGRLWAAYGLVGRLGYSGVNARYSDDDGLTWKSWHEGRTGAVPGSFPTGLGVPGGCATYTFEEPCLAPFGKNGIACFWHVVEHTDTNQTRITNTLKWTRFDGQEWSPATTIFPEENKPVGVRLRPSVNAVGVGDHDIFLASQYHDGILHYDGSVWSRECPTIPAGATISVAGDRTVMAFALVNNYKAIHVWCRSPQGKWSGPLPLVREETPIFVWSGNGQKLGFVVQPYSPANFIPLAWSCKDQRRIKVLRVPVPIP